jgi:phosphoribosylanthranilate isomerase
MRTRVKICGITRQEDALAAVQQGADAIGLVFYSKSPRFVSAADAQLVIERMPPFVCKVGLFVDASQAQVEETLQSVHLDLLQFHGDEAPDYCCQFGLPYIKALRMRDNINVVAFAQEYADASGILLDTYQPGVAGGTGQAFDWSQIPQDVPAPIILAGGLTATNVASAIEQVQPYAVDVSGGVEVSKGIKDADKIAAFMNEVKRVSN